MRLQHSAARLGHGTYRLMFGNQTHEAALLRSINSGLLDIIDTSPNYGDGAAELLVGEVLHNVKQAWAKSSAHDRSMPRVCSKFGFIEGSEFERLKNRGFADMIDFTESTKYCLHPDFMREQLNKTLKRLRLSCLDLYMIHNPEHYLINAVPLNMENKAKGAHFADDFIEEARKDLHSKLSKSFQALELEVKAGRIRSYGLSSNSFALPSTHPHFVPWDNLLSLAREAATKAGNTSHSLSSIQMPGNLLEREAITPLSFGGNGCAEWARKNRIEVIVNRPLSGFDEYGTWRFADFSFPNNYGQIKNELFDHLTPKFDEGISHGDAEMAKEIEETQEACGWLKRLITDLDAQIGEFSSVLHFHHDFTNIIMPMIMEKLEGIDEETAQKLQSYFSVYEQAVRSITGRLARNHVNENIEQLSDVKWSEGSELFFPGKLNESKPLEECALKFLLKHPLVSTVLIGMSNPRQVESVLRIYETLDE